MKALNVLFLFVATGFAAELNDNPHARLIRGFNDRSFNRGKNVYDTICITCHGTPEREGTLPTSRPFWKEPFKNGGDPYSLFKTLTHGLGQMPALAVLSPEERYDAIHYLREAFVRPHNPSAYFKVDDKYLASLPRDLESLARTHAMEQKEPPYLRMDFGPAQFWTIEAATNNIAYKGIAVRLDEGSGGISKGRAWILYDHDTMRVAAAWTGTNYIDWRNIAYDGSHGTHVKIVGKKELLNPPGPGWANPKTDDFEDPRFHGRDNKPYGPLPREWARFNGLYYHSNKVVLSYQIGDANILELPSYENGRFIRALNISKSSHRLTLRLTPEDTTSIDAASTPLKVQIEPGKITTVRDDLSKYTNGGPARWNPPLATSGKIGAGNQPFAIDEIIPPPDAANAWHTWMRFGGFDFFKDPNRAAICTWNGDVWIVTGIQGDLSRLVWKRIASGLFQPLGLKIVDEKIYVTCRDQIARLHDLNGDEEIDFVENFNSDHQVTEHFHEFAMGLQTDREGNFYYAKSARHALPALVPHHGTLLKVTRDGSRTDIIANGFRAANGVCINGDGTFFVTDQEGHWTPKNRINWVRPGRFYGNFMGYHDRKNADEMDQPLVWITNEMDRSPGELVRITSPKWGALNGSLINLSYGTGRIFIVPHEKIGDTTQGAVCQLPMDDLPTGAMRGRIHPVTGDLFACGLYSWAGNRQHDGGFYRIRPTGKPAWLPTQIKARKQTVEITFSDPIEIVSPKDFALKSWAYKRSANYGSKHLDEKPLPVAAATLSADKRTVTLNIPNLAPTMSMEIKAMLQTTNGATSRVIHNTIHTL